MFETNVSLTLQDHLTSPLGKIITQVETLTKGFETLTKGVDLFAKSLGVLGETGRSASLAMSGLNRSMGTFDSRLLNVAEKTTTTARGMREMAEAGNLAASSMERANLSMRGMRAGGFGGGGGTGGRHGGGGILGAVGGAIGGIPGAAIGMAVDFTIGKDIIKGALSPAMEYQQALSRVKMLGGITPQDINMIQAAVAKSAASTPGINLTQGVDMFREAYSILGVGKQREAAELLPTLTEIKATLAGFSEHMPQMRGKEAGMLQSVVKMAEQTGHITSGADFKDFSGKLVRGLIAGGGMVSPAGFGQVIKYMRSAKFGKDEDFLFGPLMFLAQEMSGSKGGSGGQGGGGVSPMVTAFDQALNKGSMTKGFAASLQKLGLMPSTPGVKLDTTTIQTLIKSGAIKDGEQIIRNPYTWIQKTFLPALLSKEHMTKDQFNALDQAGKAKIINKHLAGTNRMISDLIFNFTISEKAIERHIAMYKQIGTLQEEYNKAMATQAMQLQDVGLQWDIFITRFGMLKPVQAALTTGIDLMSRSMKWLNGALDKNPFPAMEKEMPIALKSIAGLTDWIGKLDGAAGRAAGASSLFIHSIDSIGAVLAYWTSVLTGGAEFQHIVENAKHLSFTPENVGYWKREYGIDKLEEAQALARQGISPTPGKVSHHLKGTHMRYRPFAGAESSSKVMRGGSLVAPPPATPLLQGRPMFDEFGALRAAPGPAAPAHAAAASPAHKQPDKFADSWKNLLKPVINIQQTFQIHGDHKEAAKVMKTSMNELLEKHLQNRLMASLAHDSSSGFSGQQGTMVPMIPNTSYS